MRRCFLLALLAVPCVLQATTTTFTSCSAGTTTYTPCPGNLSSGTGLRGPAYFISAYAQASDTGEGNISALSQMQAFYLSCSPDCPPLPVLSASAQAIVKDTDYTAGPLRSGFIQINETIFTLHGNPATDWNITGGPYTYGGCLPGTHSLSEGCMGSATLPFELGTPFQVFVGAPSSPAVISISPGEQGRGGDEEVTLTFKLFEANGTTPVPFSAVPEASTYGLVLFGLGACLIWMRRSSA